ncbi:MAG: FimB/Mfa2 family fimbrial subunit [Odoribacteraceae bacterium]|jgi:hypothetical protein|nr:FimB/Mfa2 family fimbrial subunit [Odoribacteraceae bacterium]
MKGTLLALLALILVSCNKQEDVEGKRATLLLEAFELESREILQAGISSLRVIALQDGIVARYYFYPAPNLPGNEFTVNLPLGKYDILVVANGPGEKEVSCNVGDPLEKVLLNLTKEGDAYREAPDFMTAIKQVNITTTRAAPIPVSLSRRVGKIKVALEELPAGIDSLRVELANVPSSAGASGGATGAVAIVKRVNHVKGSSSATAEIMTFPVAAGKAEVGVLYSSGYITRRGFMKLAPAIDENRVVAVTGRYLPTSPLGFEFSAQGWDETNLVDGGALEMGELDEVFADNTPPAGVPTGSNLLVNGGFEAWDADTLPAGWKYNRDGAYASARASGARAMEGNFSCLLGPRSYIYQDVAVTERRCYQLQVHAFSNTELYKWRVFCTWRRTASSALPASSSTSVQSQEFGSTSSWMDPFNAQGLFRAPVGARFLRVELRAYSEGASIIPTNEGLFLDNLSLYLLAE